MAESSALRTFSVNVLTSLPAAVSKMSAPVASNVFTLSAFATTVPSPKITASVAIAPLAVNVVLPVVLIWLTAKPSISLKVMTPEPTSVLAGFRLCNLTLLRSLPALVNVMVPLLAVVTRSASAARIDPVPTCCTRPIASTVRVPLVVILDKSAGPPEVMEMVPVSDW